MPIYGDMANFMTRVNAANPHFERVKDSSLHALLQRLGQNSTAAQIRAAINNIPQAKQQKYQTALNHLRATFPGLAVPAPALQMVPVGNAVQNLNVVAPQAQQRPAPALPPAMGLVRVVTPIPTQGYNLIVDPDPVTPTVDVAPPLTRAQVVRINEAVARTRRSLELAIDAIGSVTAPVGGAQPTPDQALYQRLFGAFDATRRQDVRTNFMSIGIALGGVRGGRQGTLNFIDARNDAVKSNWYAATVRNSLGNGTTVKMWIGRAFFQAGSYAATSDATIVTIVHELAHACFGASDVPTVASGQVLNANGMPPGGAAVCNDLASDEALAASFPDRAVRNADNYGQFAWLILSRSGQ